MAERTKTSSFGVGKRESHDSSAFYARNLFGDRVLEGTQTDESLASDLAALMVPQLGDWVDRIYCQSSERMNQIPDNSIGLAFTSPPYNVGKEYDDNVDLKAYLQLIERVGAEVYKKLRPGGRYVINIANLGRKPYIPLHAFFYDVHMRLGFLPMGEIIWQKAKGATGSVAWGSWKSAKSPRLRDIHEYLLVFAKQFFSRPDDGDSRISATEFMDATLSIWELPPESAKRVNHPAPFSEQLASRVINLYTYVGDVVLDPFVGSGTTCVSANKNKRHYVGYDISKQYCDLARRRIVGKGKLYMPSEKTESSELSVAFGLLDIDDPLDVSPENLERLFQHTLAPEKYERFRAEFTNPVNSRLYSRLHNVGKRLRASYSLFGQVASLQWSGPSRQGRTISEAQDLLVANTHVSVKAESNVLSNMSPSRLFESVPSGQVAPDRSENWYLQTDPTGYQALYSSVRDIRLVNFPSSVEQFEEEASPSDREELQAEIEKLRNSHRTAFNRCYLQLCENVAKRSAEIFNNNYARSLGGSSRNAVTEHLVRSFFRMGSAEYILAGTAGKNDYAVIIPSITQWKKDWKVVGVEAIPDLARRQSVVMINIQYQKRGDNLPHTATFHVEIRWSHGKFRQAPEAKLYKNFRWSDIAFVKSPF